MKKKLFLWGIAILMTGTVSAQFTATDVPTIGASQSYFVLDSTAGAFDGIIGTGVTWDYSATTGYNGLKDTILVVDAAATNYDTSFTNSDRAIVVNHYFMNYYTNPTSTEQQKTGFVFINSNPNVPINNIVVPFDAAIDIHQYPMNVGSTVTSNFQGNASVTITVNPVNPATITPFMKGTIMVTLDGKGTLKTATTVYSDVYRFRIEEHASTFVTDLGDSAFYNRVQYEYYDFTQSKLPILLHASAQFLLGTTPMIDVHPVLCVDDPQFAAVQKEKWNDFAVYPNPAKNKVTIQLDKPMSDMQLIVRDNLGRVVMRRAMKKGQNTFDITALNPGVYFVQIGNKETKRTKKLVVR